MATLRALINLHSSPEQLGVDGDNDRPDSDQRDDHGEDLDRLVGRGLNPKGRFRMSFIATAALRAVSENAILNLRRSRE